MISDKVSSKQISRELASKRPKLWRAEGWSSRLVRQSGITTLYHCSAAWRRYGEIAVISEPRSYIIREVLILHRIHEEIACAIDGTSEPGVCGIQLIS